MKNAILPVLMLATIATPLTVAPAQAQRDDGDYRWRDDDPNWNPADSYRDGKYRERRLSRDDRVYRGKDGRTYCRRSDGTTGAVIGGVGGGLLGTLAGGAGGALLGRSVDRGKVKCR